MFNINNFLQDLAKLTNINCGTYQPAGVMEVAKIMQNFYTQLNFTTKLINVGNQVGPMLFATNKPNATHYDVVLIGHLDTVYNANIVHNHLLTVKNNQAYGLGAIDMKSGLLVGLYALQSLPANVLNSLSIAIINNPDEEISSIYSEEKIVEICKKSKSVLVLEPPEGGLNTLVNKRKGIQRFKVEFSGIAAHASVPTNGASAIMEMAHFLTFMQQFNNASLNTTFNVNPVSGGSVGGEGASNVISDTACAYIEIRFLDDNTFKNMQNTIMHRVQNPLDNKVKITFTQVSYKTPLANTTQSLWLEDLVLKSANAVNMPITYTTSAGGSDGNLVSALGIATIDGLGAVGGGMHNANLEFLDITSVEPKVILLQQILTDISKL